MPSQDLPLWVLIFERIGPGSAILVFTGAVLWKLVPGITRLLVAWRKQSDAVTQAVPQVLDGLRNLVGHAERVADRLTDGESRLGTE
jgi:hypothetical protein